MKTFSIKTRQATCVGPFLGMFRLARCRAKVFDSVRTTSRNGKVKTRLTKWSTVALANLCVQLETTLKTAFRIIARTALSAVTSSETCRLQRSWVKTLCLAFYLIFSGRL